MAKKFQKNSSKQRRKFIYRPPTLWETIDEKSKDILLEVKAQAIMRGDKPYVKNKKKKWNKRSNSARQFSRRRAPALLEESKR